MSYVDPSRNPLHDPDSGLYHGDVPVDASVGPVLRPADDPDGFSADASAEMGPDYQPAAGDGETATYDPGDGLDDLTVEQLKPIAREYGIAYSTLNKDDLITAIREYEAKAEAEAKAPSGSVESGAGPG